MYFRKVAEPLLFKTYLDMYTINYNNACVILIFLDTIPLSFSDVCILRKGQGALQFLRLFFVGRSTTVSSFPLGRPLFLIAGGIFSSETG